ncbi:hypothetical protein NMG60_11013751 [Bertholletia excelsa]
MEVQNRQLLLFMLSVLISSFIGQSQDINSPPAPFPASPSPSPISNNGPVTAPSASPSLSPLSPVSALSNGPAPSPSSVSPSPSPVSYADETLGTLSAPSPFSYSASISMPPSASSPSPNGADAIDLAKIPEEIQKHMKSGIISSEAGIELLNKLLKDPAMPAPTGECLKQCATSLASAIEDLRKAIEDSMSTDFFFLSEDLNSASRDISNCDRCFETDNPVADINQAIKTSISQSQDLIKHTF